MIASCAQAAELKAAGQAEQALAVVQRICMVEPAHTRAHFAAGQLHAELKRWPEAEDAYLRAAGAEPEQAQRARCWLGAGEYPSGFMLTAFQS
jgi:tetratricopeptide (TPR) repeat protein